MEFAQLAASTPKPRPLTNQRRVFIVDDDAAVRETLATMLKPLDVLVETFASGADMLARLEPFPDLVVLDVMMPDLDGYEVCRRLRSAAQGRFVPVVMVTALDDRDAMVRGLEVGADEFLHKPVHSAELRARTSNLLRLKQYSDLLEVQRDTAQYELALTRAELMVAERTATLGTLTGGVGHELNNLATVLSANIPILREYVQGNRDAEDILEDFDHLFARLQSHSASLQRLAQGDPSKEGSAELVDVVERVKEMLKVVGKTKYVPVQVRAPSRGVAVCLSTTAAEQVVMNVMSNAADACMGIVGAKIELTISASEDTATLLIRDTGSGMEPHVQARCFDPFFTTKPQGKGAGLGLVVVKRYVELVGGKVELQTAPGAGTTVRIEVPLCPNTKSRA